MRNGKILILDVPIPTPQPGEALVQTAVSLVSAGTERMVVEFAGKSLLGKARSRPDLVRQVIDKARREGLFSTLETAFNRLDQLMPLGYSSAGTIQAVGEGLVGFKVGDRVACAGGGYAVHAEYAVVPRNLLTPLPDNVDFESGAFTTLGAITMHGFRLTEAQLGERVAIIGLGLLGQLAVGIARLAGCQVFGVDLNPARVALAKEMGAEAVVREQAEEAALAFSRGRGCDVVLICADTPSSDPVELAGVVARDRARVVAVGAVGLQIPRKMYYEKELSFINSRSYGPGRYDPGYEEGGHDYPMGYVRWTEGRNMEAFVELLSSGGMDVRPLITHRFPIGEAPKAYDLITGKTGEPFLGVLLSYQQDQPLVDDNMLQKVASISGPAQVRSDAVVRLGVLGAGNFATSVMLPALSKLPGVERVGIASASGLSAQHAANRYGFHYAVSDEARIITDPAINAVAILTRHNLHARQVLAALAAGKHVFCEKPLATNITELDQIVEALRWGIGDGGKVEFGPREDTISPGSRPLVMVGFNRRFASLARHLHEFIKEEKEPLVMHYRVNAGYLPPNHWLHDPAQGGGRIIGEGCHFVDFLSFLVGEPPVSVTAQVLPDVGRYREDNVVLTFAFPDGSLGTLHYLANGDKAVPKERVEVFGGGRVAVLDDFRSLEVVYRGRRKTYRSRLRQDKGHRREWEVFIATIQAGGPPPIPYRHLIGVTKATFAALEALRRSERIKCDSYA